MYTYQKLQSKLYQTLRDSIPRCLSEKIDNTSTVFQSKLLDKIFFPLSQRFCNQLLIYVNQDKRDVQLAGCYSIEGRPGKDWYLGLNSFLNCFTDRRRVWSQLLRGTVPWGWSEFPPHLKEL